MKRANEQRRVQPVAVLSTVLVLSLLAVGSPAVAQQAEEDERRVIRKERAIFLDDDGQVVEIRGPGQSRTIELRPLLFSQGGLGRGYLGVDLTQLNDALRSHFGAPAGLGVMVSEVEEGSPAFDAGIEVGDIITRVDGEDISTSGELSRIIRGMEANEVAEIELYRAGRLERISAAVGERERAAVRFSPDGIVAIPPIEGLSEDITIHLDDALGDLGEYFNSDEWRERMKQWEELDMATMEERMRALEERLKELALKLNQLGDGQQ